MLEDQIESTEERAREFILGQGAEISGATEAVSSLSDRMMALLGEVQRREQSWVQEMVRENTIRYYRTTDKTIV